MFEVQDVNKNDKVIQYQRDLSVQHFAVYFEILFFYFFISLNRMLSEEH